MATDTPPQDAGRPGRSRTTRPETHGRPLRNRLPDWLTCTNAADTGIPPAGALMRRSPRDLTQRALRRHKNRDISDVAEEVAMGVVPLICDACYQTWCRYCQGCFCQCNWNRNSDRRDDERIENEVMTTWPADKTIVCSGCGAAFARDDRGWIIHPEPWCSAMASGEERPRVAETS